MTSLYTFLPILRKQNVNRIFYKVFSPTFISVPETFYVVELVSKCSNFRYFRYFNGQLCNGRPLYGHIRHQRFQINLNQCFVFRFLQILVLTVFPFFSAAILDRRYEPNTLVCNPIQSNELKNITYQFEENYAKIEDVRVPH